MKKNERHSALKSMSDEEKTEYMKEWFHSRYEDPVNHTPYMTSEGGYIWIYGGPFDAQEELENEFFEFVDELLIEELSEELSDESFQWTRTQNFDQELYPRADGDLYYELDNLSTDGEIVIRLLKDIDQIEAIVKHSETLNPLEIKFANIMHYSFCITCLESFLSDIFARIVLRNEEYKIKFLKSDKLLSEKKIPYGELFAFIKEIDSILSKRIVEISFHNIHQAKTLYQSVLGIEMDPPDVEFLRKKIDKRHDFVHRGGKNPEGVTVETNKDEIIELIDFIKRFCIQLNVALIEKKLLESVTF